MDYVDYAFPKNSYNSQINNEVSSNSPDLNAPDAQAISSYVDIHCHSTLPPYNRCKSTLWFHKSIPSKKERQKRSKDTFLYTQSDFITLAKSNHRVILAALYPLEQGFLEPAALNVLVGAVKEAVILAVVLFASALPPWRTRLVRCFTHSYFKDLCLEYNRLISPEESTIPAQAARDNSLDTDWKFTVVTCYQDIQAIIEQEPHTIAVIPTIEGGHSLGCGSNLWTSFVSLEDLYNKNLLVWKDPMIKNPVSFEMDKNELLLQTKLKVSSRLGRVKMLKENVVANIRAIKKWGTDGGHTPFFITLSHHFWNQLCGHAISMATFKQNTLIFNQRFGMLKGVSELGKVAVNELLSRENGRRILIDTKHMSLTGKAWYYDFVEQNNLGLLDESNNLKSWYNRLMQEPLSQPGTPAWIPIVSSHAGLNGRPWMTATEVINNHSKADDYYNHPDKNIPVHAMLNPWEINLSDEEVVRIFESDGIIGINMDERIVSGTKLNDELTEKGKKLWNDSDKYADLWVKAIVQQLLRVGRVLFSHLKLKMQIATGVDIDPKNYLLAHKDTLQTEIPDNTISWDEQKSIWQLCAIGSDFDGMINPLDAFATTMDFDSLYNSLFRILMVMTTNPESFEINPDPILKDRTAEQIKEIVDMFMFGNAMHFLEKYYTDEYRKKAG